MSRFNLPDINFLEKSPEDIERDMLFFVEEETGLTLSNADPRRKFLQSLVAFVTLERNKLDYGLKQNLLAYAEDEFLDHKGVDVNTPRLGDDAAVTTMEFVLEEARVSTLVIESGTLFLVGEDTFFETTVPAVVPVGQHIVQVRAKCTETGDKGNGYLPGEITNLVRPLPWVKSVRNITVSSGGVDVEDNDAYAERIRLAPESFSTAGPEGAYEYWAKKASQRIVDVKVLSPSDGVIDIRILMENGDLPTEEDLNKVLSICSNKTVRPLTDKVTAGPPDVIDYGIDVEYWILETNAAILNVTQSRIEKAVADFQLWQSEKMGRDVDLSELIVMMKAAGAHRITVNSPMYAVVEKHQVAKANMVNVVFGGLTDE